MSDVLKGGRNLQYKGGSKEKLLNKGENENNILTFQPYFYRIIPFSQTPAHLVQVPPLQHPAPTGPNPQICPTRETLYDIHGMYVPQKNVPVQPSRWPVSNISSWQVVR